MSIKPSKNKAGEPIYVVRYAKRHPEKRYPFSLQRNAKTLAEAKRLEKKLMLEVAERLHRAVVPTWRETVGSYEQHYLDQGISKKTVADALYHLKAYTLEPWGERTVDRIETREIRELISSALEGKSERHKANVLKFIRATFNIAYEAGHIPKNPSPVLKFRPKDRLLSVFNWQQANLFLEKAKELESPWYPLWCAALYTGMRNGELYALKWEHVSLDENLIKVKASWNNVDGFKSTKSGDERIVPIAAQLLSLLKELKLRSAGSEFVLPRIPYWSKGLQARELRRFVVGIGLTPLRFHDLRASWATFLIRNSVAPIRVMSMGGWKNLKTMMLYIRMAGIDVQGGTDSLDLHNPGKSGSEIIQFPGQLPNVAINE